MVKVKDDLTGKIFERLTVLEQAEDYISSNGTRVAQWLCQCECGSEPVVVYGTSLKRGHTRSCGCLHDESLRTNAIKHGDSYSKLYSVYTSIINRCYNKNDKRYDDYGGRGIYVCKEWRESYVVFKEWSIKNGYAEGLTIDRINNDDGYTPNNCRWTIRKIQQNNTRFNHLIEYNNEIKTIAEWAKEFNINYNTLYLRLYRGWSIGDALTKHVQTRR